MTHRELGARILEKLEKDLIEVGEVEARPRMEATRCLLFWGLSDIRQPRQITQRRQLRLSRRRQQRPHSLRRLRLQQLRQLPLRQTYQETTERKRARRILSRESEI